MNEPRETDSLKYTGNAIPRVIRLAWTGFFMFAIYYLATFCWPDLMAWLK